MNSSFLLALLFVVCMVNSSSAMDSTLESDHMNQVLRLGRSHIISYSTVGPADGKPLLFIGGMGSHRLSTMVSLVSPWIPVNNAHTSTASSWASCVISAGLSIGASEHRCKARSVAFCISRSRHKGSEREKAIFEAKGICEAMMESVRVAGKENNGGSNAEVMVALEKNGKFPTLREGMGGLSRASLKRRT